MKRKKTRYWISIAIILVALALLSNLFNLEKKYDAYFYIKEYKCSSIQVSHLQADDQTTSYDITDTDEIADMMAVFKNFVGEPLAEEKIMGETYIHYKILLDDQGENLFDTILIEVYGDSYVTITYKEKDSGITSSTLLKGSWNSPDFYKVFDN